MVRDKRVCCSMGRGWEHRADLQPTTDLGKLSVDGLVSGQRSLAQIA